MSRGVRLAGVGAALGGWRLDPREVRAAWGPAAQPSPTAGPPPRTLAVAGADEDTLTLAAAAAEAALAATGVDVADVDALCWGTTRPPLAEGPSHALLAAALRCSPRAGGVLCAGSPHAGMEAFVAGVDAVAAGSARWVLVVASDALVPGPGTALEGRCGAGAAAVLVGPEGPAGVGVRVQRWAPYLEAWRGDGEPATRDTYDPRLQREVVFLPAVTAVAEHLGALDPRAWSIPDPDGRTAAVLTRRIGAGTPASSAVDAAAGDTGAAAPWLGALPALDAPGRVGVIGHGGGRTTGVLVEVDGPVPGAGRLRGLLGAGTPVHYLAVLRARRQLVPTGEAVPMGVPPGSALHVRGAHEVLGLLGARCAECGTIATPPSVHPTCTGCGGTKLEAVPLARTGVVHTFVVNQTMPPPFEAPLPLLVVDLDDGARLQVQGTGDGTDLRVGARVELVLRRYALERGVPVYGYKARVVSG